MDISTILDSGYVTRFHAVPGITPQSIAEHSWGVAMILEHCYGATFDNPVVILKALTHDCAELVTGDVPAPMKWECPELKEPLEAVEEKFEKATGIHYRSLEQVEIDMIKVCDCLEGMQYCFRRTKCGEREAVTPFWAWNDYLLGNFVLNSKADTLRKELCAKMQNMGFSYNRSKQTWPMQMITK